MTSQRVFIGIPVGDHERQLIDRLLEPMRARFTNLRWVPAGNYHLTLAFLGDIDPGELETVRAGLAGAYAGHAQFRYQLSALERFPNSGGRIIALTGEVSESLLGLATATRDMLTRCGLPFERQTFRPHITLARVRNPKHPLLQVEQPVNLGMHIKRVALYRSRLTESGSIHSTLKHADLR